MKIVRGREGKPSAQRTDTFTGEVWGDVVLADDGITVNSVFFAPGARTHWHTHDQGQILVVTSGQGRARSRDGSGGKLTPGDVVWIPPGEEHWHGSDADSYVLHLAISLGGHEWLDPVSDDEYGEGWA